MNVSIEVYPDESIYISGISGDDFLEAVAQKGAEGYKICKGATMLSMYIKRCVMSKQVSTTAEQPVEAAQTSEEVVKEPVEKYSQAMVSSFKNNKDKLENYGRLFGIELKKSKSFDNMVRDLEDHVGFPIKE